MIENNYAISVKIKNFETLSKYLDAKYECLAKFKFEDIKEDMYVCVLDEKEYFFTYSVYFELVKSIYSINTVISGETLLRNLKLSKL